MEFILITLLFIGLVCTGFWIKSLEKLLDIQDQLLDLQNEQIMFLYEHTNNVYDKLIELRRDVNALKKED